MTGNEIRIKKDGKWYYNGQEMFKISIVHLFATHLERDDNGGYYIHLGPEVFPVVVEDSPFFVSDLRVEPDKLVLIFHDEQAMEIREKTRLLFEGDVPYLSFRWVKDTKLSRGVFWAVSKFFDIQGEDVYIVPPMPDSATLGEH